MVTAKTPGEVSSDMPTFIGALCNRGGCTSSAPSRRRRIPGRVPGMSEPEPPDRARPLAPFFFSCSLVPVISAQLPYRYAALISAFNFFPNGTKFCRRSVMPPDKSNETPCPVLLELQRRTLNPLAMVPGARVGVPVPVAVYPERGRV